MDLPYFLSTHITAFKMALLKHFNAELLIGQVSYNQRCDVYNYIHRYEDKCKAIPPGRPERCAVPNRKQASVSRYLLNRLYTG